VNLSRQNASTSEIASPSKRWTHSILAVIAVVLNETCSTVSARVGKSQSLSGIGSPPGSFWLVRVGRVTEQIVTCGRNTVDVVDAARRVPLGESFGVATVALETFEVAVGSVLARLLKIRGDCSMNERCVDLFERPERVSKAVHLHLTPPRQTNCWRRHSESWLAVDSSTVSLFKHT
jgi:hypothetical protein